MRRLSVALVPMLLVSLLAFSGGPALGRGSLLKCKKVTAGNKSFRMCSGFVRTTDKSASLDTDVTLPPTGKGPFPLIVLLHGLGGSKTSFESSTIDGTAGSTFHVNNLWFASRGYAVLNYTARGHASSTCENQSIEAKDGDSDLYPPSAACLAQLDSIDYEIKDTQDLVGRLVDGTLLDARGVRIAPKKIGAIGASYGGGHVWLLTRKNVWSSPQGTKVRLAAAVPIIGWTDLGDALVPNGRASDDPTKMPPLDESTRAAQPVGPPKSFLSGFYLTLKARSSVPGVVTGYLSTWYSRFLNGGEPYEGAVVEDAVHKLLSERSAYYVAKKGSFETPILAENGFTDGIFPVVQAIQMYNRLRAEDPSYPISMEFGDTGHQMAQNKPEEFAAHVGQDNAWLDYYLKGKGAEPASFVEARTTVCGSDAIGDLYRGPTWQSLQSPSAPFDLGLGGTTLASDVDDPHAGEWNPIQLQDADRCRHTNTAVATGNAAGTAPLPDGLTMLGLPEVTLDADPSVADMYVAARLFDVDPVAGTETLVTRGIYRLGASGSQHVVFELFGNAYDFAPGHSLKLELTANDSPSFRASDASGTIAISNVSISVPQADQASLVAP